MTPNPPSTGPQAFHPAFGPAALLAFSVLVFLPSLWNGFVLDDLFYVVHNPVLRDPSQWPRFLYDHTALLSERSLSRLIWRPLLGLSYALNSLPAGASAFWFHLHDSLLHGANTLLVLALLLRLTGTGPHAWAGAVLFCCHPVQAQSVAYAGGRPSLLSLGFCLVSLLLYAGPAKGFRARGSRLLLSVGAFCLALLSKESSLFLIPVLAALDRLESPDGPSIRPALKRLAVFVVAGILYVLARAWVLGLVSQRGPWGGGWVEHFQLASHGLFKTVSLAFWPVGLREPYGFLLSPHFMAESVLMAAVLALAAGLAVWGAKLRRVWGLGLFWAFCALLPVSNIVPFGALAADRYLYAPMAGAAILAASQLKGRLKGWGGGAALLLAGVMASACAGAQLKWRSGFVLASEAAAAAPRDPYPALRLASYYLEWGMLARAEELAVRGFIPEAPPDVRRLAYRRLAVIRMTAGQWASARELLEASLSADPGQRGALELLARCCLAMGDAKAARDASARAAVLP
ncbi:MAG: tetratricopeptide repeat protein [Elusimicrobia bacterium]|nr:tetratricopeptide repeat protein [Elusimicrobiota bacterium]